MVDLRLWTTLVNLAALASALWLGFYIITRSPSSLISWLAALTLWALSGYFFHNALAVNQPINEVLTWLRQSVIIVLPIWFHLTSLLSQGSSHAPGKSPRLAVNRFAVPFAYGYALVLIALGLSSHLLLAQVETNSAIYTNNRAPGPLYPLFILFVAVGSVPTMWNLWRGRVLTSDPNLRSRYTPLMIATGLAILGGLWFGLGTQLDLPLPSVVGDLSLGTGVVLLGYAVVRFSALLEGRPIERDFLYTLLVVGSLTAFYVLVVLILYLNGQLTFLALELTLVGTIAANTLFDGVRITLDGIFYQGRFQRLRANLRALAREAGTGQSLHERLQALLTAMCAAFRLTRGFIALRQGEGYAVRATFRGPPLDQILTPTSLNSSEIIGLALPTRRGLGDMALLIPLSADGAQIGAIVLGPREGNAPYQEDDYELLEDLSDQLARLIHGVELQRDHAQQIDELVQAYRERERNMQLQLQQLLAEHEVPRAAIQTPEWDEQKLVALVEDGLRHCHDYPYLGESDLAHLRSVQFLLDQRVDGSPLTHLDRGKAVGKVLMLALDELKPDTPLPKTDQAPPRDWHLFLILHDSYVLETPNRDIMSKLYIGEGTFNRTRRRALRATAKALAEMEARAN